jgi:hypothetical protein
MRRTCPARSFTEELVRTQNCDDGFLALLRNDGDLHLAFLDIEDRIRGVSLGKDDLLLAVLTNAPALANLGEDFGLNDGRHKTFHGPSCSMSNLIRPSLGRQLFELQDQRKS